MSRLTCFTPLPTPDRTFFARLVGRKPKEHGFIAVQNLLAERELASLTAADVENVLSDYEIPRPQANPRLREFYRAAIKHFAMGGRLSEVERASLAHLRYVLGLAQEEADTDALEILRELFRGRLKAALRNGHLSDSEKQELDAIAASFALPDDARTAVYKEECLTVLQQAFNEAVSDQRLTEAEEQRLAAMATNLGITVTHDANTQRLVERFRLLARIEAGKLPDVDTPLTLQRGEVCHAVFPCHLHEKRTVTKSIRYAGPSGRIRIMKGLSYRYGSVSVNRVTSEELRQIDGGTLYVTNKRLLFNGAGKNFNVPYKKIVQFTIYKDGIEVQKDAGRDQYFVGSGDLELVGAILEGSLRRSRD